MTRTETTLEQLKDGDKFYFKSDKARKCYLVYIGSSLANKLKPTTEVRFRLAANPAVEPNESPCKGTKAVIKVDI